MQTTNPTADPTPETAPQKSKGTDSTTILALEEELLIEEISIDGMCGVY